MSVGYGEGCWGELRPVVNYFQASPGETNRLIVGSYDDMNPQAEVASIFGAGPGCIYAYTGFDGLVVNDGAADIVSAPNCGRVRPRIVHCDSLPLYATLGDGNDQLWISAYDLPVTVDGGTGDDSIRVANLSWDTVDCGSGVDTVIADLRDTVAATCESVTRVSA
jgi:hypothetical protein